MAVCPCCRPPRVKRVLRLFTLGVYRPRPRACMCTLLGQPIRLRGDSGNQYPYAAHRPNGQGRRYVDPHDQPR